MKLIKFWGWGSSTTICSLQFVSTIPLLLQAGTPQHQCRYMCDKQLVPEVFALRRRSLHLCCRPTGQGRSRGFPLYFMISNHYYPSVQSLQAILHSMTAFLFLLYEAMNQPSGFSTFVQLLDHFAGLEFLSRHSACCAPVRSPSCKPLPLLWLPWRRRC